MFKIIILCVLLFLTNVLVVAEQFESDDYTQDDADLGNTNFVDLRHSCSGKWTLKNGNTYDVNVNVSEYIGADGEDEIVNAYDVDVKAGQTITIDIGNDTDTVLIMQGYEAQDVERSRDCNNKRTDVAPVVATVQLNEQLSEEQLENITVYTFVNDELGDSVLTYVVNNTIQIDSAHYEDGDYAVFSNNEYIGRFSLKDNAGVFTLADE